MQYSESRARWIQAIIHEEAFLQEARLHRCRAKSLGQYHVDVFEPGVGRDRAPTVRFRLPASHHDHAIAKYQLKKIKQRVAVSGHDWLDVALRGA